MKKYICLILCLCFLLVAGCNSKTNNNASDTKSGKLSDKIEFKIYDARSKIWLSNSHIKEISLKTENGEQSLIITATESGKELLKKACEANMGKILSASADKHILYTAFVMETIDSGEFLIDNKAIDYNYLFNFLTDAKDKMAGVTPPETLIKEDVAKSTAFGNLNASADNASNIEIKLDFSEESLGWKYNIDFTLNSQSYKCEINAHTGEIVRFVTDLTS